MAEAVFGTAALADALAPLAFVMTTSFGVNRISTTAMQAMFWAFSVTMGLSLSSIFFIYTGPSIAAVLRRAGAFAGLSLYGYTTDEELVGPRASFLIMGLVGVLIASVINIFLPVAGPCLGHQLPWCAGLPQASPLTRRRSSKPMYDQVAGTAFRGQEWSCRAR